MPPPPISPFSIFAFPYLLLFLFLFRYVRFFGEGVVRYRAAGSRLGCSCVVVALGCVFVEREVWSGAAPPGAYAGVESPGLDLL